MHRKQTALCSYVASMLAVGCADTTTDPESFIKSDDSLSLESKEHAIYAGPIAAGPDYTYCFTNPSHPYNVFTRTGLQRSWEMESNIFFREVPCSSSPRTRIVWDDTCEGHFSSGNEIHMHSCNQTADTHGAERVSIHEMGHQLSFGHENNPNRPEVTAQCADDEGGLGTAVGPFDPSSVMLGHAPAGYGACGFTVSDDLTETDIAGVQEFYGGLRPVAAASWGVNRMDVFFRAKSDNNVIHAYFDGSWGVYNMGGGRFWGSPAAVAPATNSLFIFGRNAFELSTYYRQWTGSQWTAWTSLGGWTKGTPTAIRRGTGIVELFTRGTDDRIYRKTWNGSWTPNWQLIDQFSYVRGQLAAFSWDGNRIDIIARSKSDGQIVHHVWNGSSWSVAGVVPVSAGRESPTAVSWGPNRIDMFANSNGDLRHFYYTNHWESWVLGPNAGVVGSPAAIAPAFNRLAVFYTNISGSLVYRFWNGSAWSVATSIASNVVGDPSVASWEADRVHVFYKKGQRFHTRNVTNGTSWSSEVQFGIDGI